MEEVAFSFSTTEKFHFNFMLRAVLFTIDSRVFFSLFVLLCDTFFQLLLVQYRINNVLVFG